MKDSKIAMSEERETKNEEIHKNSKFIIKTGKNHE